MTSGHRRIGRGGIRAMPMARQLTGSRPGAAQTGGRAAQPRTSRCLGRRHRRSRDARVSVEFLSSTSREGDLHDQVLALHVLTTAKSVHWSCDLACIQRLFGSMHGATFRTHPFRFGRFSSCPSGLDMVKKLSWQIALPCGHNLEVLTTAS